jgi:hypothetical protein
MSDEMLGVVSGLFLGPIASLPGTQAEAPKSAKRLVATFTKRYDLKGLKLRWREGDYNSQYRNDGMLIICVPRRFKKDKAWQKRVLLHELAHAVMFRRYGSSEGHSVRFYKFLWRQYRKYDCDLKKCFEEESRYKKNSVRAWRKVFKDEPLPVDANDWYAGEHVVEDMTTFVETAQGVDEHHDKVYEVVIGGKVLGLVYRMPRTCLVHHWNGEREARKMQPWWMAETSSGKHLGYVNTRKQAAYRVYSHREKDEQ